MSNVKYSVVGTGYYIKLYDSNHPLYKKLKEITTEKTLWEYVYDFRTFGRLGLKDEQGNFYQSIGQIKPSKIIMAFNLDIFSRLEIRPFAQKNRKIMFRDLENLEKLFPDEFKINEVRFTNPGFMIIDGDKGHFGSTTHPFEYSPQSLYEFETMYVPELDKTVISNIWVDKHQVILKRNDTINTDSLSFLK